MAKEFASGIASKLKIFTLILGVVVVTLASRSAFYNLYTVHEAFYGASIACFAISVVIFIAPLIGNVLNHPLFRSLDMTFHVLAAVVLIVTSILFINHVAKTTRRFDPLRHYYEEQLSAGVMGLINGLIYGTIAVFLIRQARELPDSYPRTSLPQVE